MGQAGGALRADALRNRQRLLQAAAEVVAEQGLRAQTQDIARRAGLGVGTLFRHFPTKRALIDALSREQARAAVTEIEAARAAEAPGRALDRLAEHFAGRHTRYRALAAALSDDDRGQDALSAPLLAGLAPCVRDAQRAGALRADVDARDVLLLFVACARAAEATAAAGPLPRQRLTTIMLDGLRTSTPSTLPRERPPALDHAIT